MSTNLENMFYVDADGRHAPWHKMGVRVQEAPTSDEALKLAGLDWEVKQSPAFIQVDGEMIDTGNIVNYRDSDRYILGTVTNRYKPVQNREAFAFTDELIGGDVRYDTAGSLAHGRVVWLLAKMPDMNVLGDTVEPYLLFANSHDGSSAVRVTMTNVRVVCQNTLNFALNGAQRTFSFMHKGDIASHLEEAKQTLSRADKYNKAFVENAEHLAKKRFTKEQVQRMMNELFPIQDDDVTEVQVKHMEIMRDNFRKMLRADDLQNFRGTGWWLVNAASDYAYHARPIRLTQNYQDNMMRSAMVGNKFLDKAYDMVMSA